jgi:hypothetical protein
MNDDKVNPLDTRELTLDEIDNVAGGAIFAPHGIPNPPPLPIQWANLPAAPPALY